MKRRGVTPNFGTKVNVGKGTVGGELDVMIGEGLEGGDEISGVVIKLSVAGDGA